MTSTPANPAPRRLAQTTRETWRALLAPRRAIAITMVSGPMLLAQWLFERNLPAMMSAIVILIGFVLIGPATWRLLFELDNPKPGTWWRLLLYGLIGVVIVLPAGHGIPGLWSVPTTFLTVAPSLFITFTLYCVGGWGLGRDIDLELSLRRQLARAERLRRERDRAELLAIRAQLDPHFLFNTLNAIAEWTRDDPLVAEQAIVKLATMLRTILSGIRSQRWPLSEELQLVRDLLELHQIRDPSRFNSVMEGWDTAGDAEVPPMLLLPLIENAMKHGPGAGHRGDVVVEVSRSGPRMTVVITNPGRFGGLRDGGEGVKMVEQRLDFAYGTAGSLSLEPVDEPPATRATVTFPVHDRRPTDA